MLFNGQIRRFRSYSNDFNVRAFKWMLEVVRRCQKLLELFKIPSGIKKYISNSFVKPLMSYLMGKLGIFSSYSNDFNVIALNGCQKLLEDVTSC